MQRTFFVLLLSTLLIACTGESDSVNTTSQNNNSVQQPALIDIVTYNIEWLGNPDSADFDGSVEQQHKAAAEDILEGDGDIYALQEIGGQTALTQLINQLNILDDSNNWKGDISDANNKQSLAFIYKTNIITNVYFETLFENQSNKFFSGRSPYMMMADVIINNNSYSIRLINLHLKCCKGNSNANKRASAMSILLPFLHQEFSNDNIIILGDLNVAHSGGARGEIQNWGTYNDQDNDQQADYSHAAGSIEDKKYNPAIKDSDIDHILISNELQNAWLAIPKHERNRFLETTISDHSPVATTLDLSRLN